MGDLKKIKELYWLLLERTKQWVHKKKYELHEYFNIQSHKITILRSLLENYIFLASLRLKKWSKKEELIAISLTEHMGDIVAAQPIADYIRNIHPKAILVWITRQPFSELITAFGVIDKIITVQCITEWALLRETKIFNRHYDLHVNKRRCPICKSVILRKTGNPIIDTDNYYKYGNLLAVMCQNAGIPILEQGPKLTIPDAVQRKIDKISLPDKFIALHVTSNEQARDWDMDKWHALTKALLEKTELSLVEIGLSKALDLNSSRYISCCGNFSILETAEIIRRASLFIGVESGPAHIANSVSTYGLIFKGAYRNFSTYHPYSGEYNNGKNAFVITSTKKASNISVDEALKASLTSLKKLRLT